MLLRPDGDDTIAIGQPAHAWLSGQLARAWAPAFEPGRRCSWPPSSTTSAWRRGTRRPSSTRRPVCRARSWSSSSTTIWSSGGARRRSCCRRAATPRCWSRCTGPRCTSAATSTTSARARLPRRAGRAAGAAARDPARRPAHGAFAPDEIVRRNQQLVWTWDSLSLGLLLDGSSSELDPWPFRERPRQPALRGTPAHRPLRRRGGDAGGAGGGPWVTLELELAR